MIHLITRGGLGNQMFQYAFALLLQQKNMNEYILINGAMHQFSRDKRELGLHHFQLTAETKYSSSPLGLWYFCKFMINIFIKAGLPSVIDILKHRKNNISKIENKLLQHGIYCPSNAHNVPSPNTHNNNKHLYGYFQSPDVLNGILDKLQKAFTICTPASKENEKIIQQIQSCNAVCLHVRRGDYGLYPQYQVCNENYYSLAVKQACETLDSPVFFVFSTGHEDIEWIKKHYHFNANIVYVDLDNPDYEELRLMMACKHFIISNSTFSWWAAVLAKDYKNCPKKVWSPSTWYKGGENVKMTCDSWILL